MPKAPFCGSCGHLAATKPKDNPKPADTDPSSSDEDILQPMCHNCKSNIVPGQPFCGFCGSLYNIPANKLLAAGTSSSAFRMRKHQEKHSEDTESVPIKPTFVYDPARRICVDVHNPNIPGTEPPAYTPNPLLINWKLPKHLDASDKARLQAIQTGVGYFYEAMSKQERCEYPVNGVQKATPWGQLTNAQKACATLERELAFAAYTASPMQLKPGEAKRRIGTANIPFSAAEQHATRKEVLELRRDEKAFGGRSQRRHQRRASSSSDDAGGNAGGTDYPRGTNGGGGQRNGNKRRTDRRQRNRGGDPRNGRNARSHSKDQGTDTDRKVAGDAARSAMLSRIADLEKASRRRKPDSVKSGAKSGEE